MNRNSSVYIPFLLLVVSVQVSSSTSVPFIACGKWGHHIDSNLSFHFVSENFDIQPKSVRIEQCNQTDSCILEPGRDYSLQVEFDSKSEARKVFLQMMVVFGKRAVVLPWFAKKNYCHTGNGLRCPIRRNQPSTFTLNVHIPKQTPNMITMLQMQLMTERRRKFLCFKLPLIIQS